MLGIEIPDDFCDTKFFDFTCCLQRMLLSDYLISSVKYAPREYPFFLTKTYNKFLVRTVRKNMPSKEQRILCDIL